MARILIADDARVMRAILRMVLQKCGHEIVGEAASGEEAATLYSKLKPDLVTLDIHMEPGDGIECLEHIMKQDPGARVLMVSAIGHQQRIDQARSLGAKGYVTKPFQHNEIEQQVALALKS
jgi:two-component system chemotaxis response regulator CheY